jgi:alpha-glucoside transport system substrate-binding protein
MHHTRKWTTVAALATLALTTSGLGVVAQDESPAASDGGEMMATGYAELDQAMGADKPMAGTQVTMQTQWISGEGDNFAAALAPFIEATGIQVSVAEVPSGQHETLVNVSLNGGAAADIIQLAQPAAIQEYGAQGLILDISPMLDTEKLLAEHPATLPLYTTDAGIFGMPYKVDVKSVVWYPIKAFEDRGYAVPTTWDELIALSDQIVADGEGSPWCVGMEAGPATGWIATDMIEDIMLRTTDAETYNAWAALEHPFNSPEVMNAFDLAGQIYFTPDYVLGGSTAILATAQTDPMDPMFNDDLANPGCWMQKQATWYGPDFFPDAKAGDGTSQYVIGEDVGLFYFPPIDPAYGTPSLGSADAFIVSADRPEVRALLQYLATPDGIKAWIDAGSAISANQATPADWYAGNYKLEVASGIVANSTVLGFDASDLMPASGAAFWNGVVEWITANGENTQAVLEGIDAAQASAG